MWVHVCVSRPLKTNYCWRSLNISPLCWRSWTHLTARMYRGEAAAVGLIWNAREAQSSEVVRLKVAAFPLCCSIARGSRLKQTVHSRQWFSLFPFQNRHRSDKRVNNRKVQVLIDRKYVSAFFRRCLWWKTRLCRFLGFLRTPLREPTQLWIKFFNSHWNGLNQIPCSNTA